VVLEDGPGPYPAAGRARPVGAAAAVARLARAVASDLVVVWGTESDVLSEAQAQRIVDALPRGKLVRVPGIGHAPTLVEPPVLTALDRFLRAR
jgi:pimeloyl-ACP methyl ester carboxylesterase